MRIKLAENEIIETGYTAYYTAYFQVGEYYFRTRDFFEMINEFSTRPRKTSHLLMAYDEDFFNKDLLKYGVDLLSVDRSDPECFENLVKACHGTTANLEIEYNSDEDASVPVMIETENEDVAFGRYSIKKRDFNALCRCAINEGGWLFETPKFAEEAKRLMNLSENPIYRS